MLLAFRAAWTRLSQQGTVASSYSTPTLPTLQVTWEGKPATVLLHRGQPQECLYKGSA